MAQSPHITMCVAFALKTAGKAASSASGLSPQAAMSSWVMTDMFETQVEAPVLEDASPADSPSGGQRYAACDKFPKNCDKFYYIWQVAGDRGAFYDLDRAISERLDAALSRKASAQFTARFTGDKTTYRFDVIGLYQQNDTTLTRRYLRRMLMPIVDHDRLAAIETAINTFNFWKARETREKLILD